MSRLPVPLTVIQALPPSTPLDRNQPPTQLIDSFGRVIRDLRLSITDRCNFRCVYCMDPDVTFAPRDELLTIDEHLDIARVAVRLGVTKVRITGGEPALHPGLIDLIRGLAGFNVDGSLDIAITTNGSFLDASTAGRWREAGLTRVTLSLDSLRQDRFAAITRSNATVDDVLAGIEAAKNAGLDPVRVNAVIVRGVNEDELVDLAQLARRLAIDVRLIEYMPLDSAHAWERTKVVPATEMLERIGSVYPLTPIGRDTTSSPATVFRFSDQPANSSGRIGIIASVTRSFCSTCSRLRITADGKVRPCLFAHDEWDIRPLLRTPSDSGALSVPSPVADGGGAERSEAEGVLFPPPRAGEVPSLRGGGGLPSVPNAHRNGTHDSHAPDPSRDAAIARFLADAVYAKTAGHIIDSPDFRQPARTMSAIGG
ncbi:MAG: GTP 3',8-cyclase MoaA [Planctomycetes bacterium]|nr:GTP 3',8-cyclase MoaA [Planctomycetota bacterium]